MAARGRGLVYALAIAAMAALTLGLQQPAAAQGIFEFLFSGLRQTHETPSLPVNLQAYADPAGSPPGQRGDAAPGVAYCVRTCDGHYFPVRAQPGMSAAAACHAFCPASRTRLYSGSNIDYAVTRDGSRYADLDTAYVYRQHLVAGCTCNGHDVFGLAHIDPARDPTLRPGDVVATENGLMAFTGTKDRAADFTPGGKLSRLLQQLSRHVVGDEDRLAQCRRSRRGHFVDRVNRRQSQRSAREIAGHLLGKRQSNWSAPATRCRTSAPAQASRAGLARR